MRNAPGVTGSSAGAEPLALGLDLGAVSVKAALLQGGRLLEGSWLPHGGDVEGTLARVLADYPMERVTHMGFTGSRSAGLAAAARRDEIVCLVEGARWIQPAARGVLSVGGERSVFVELDARGRYLAHTHSGSCAAGTGLFLEQQAATLDLSLDDFERAADGCRGPDVPRVASRCAVFARTDLVHLLQAGHGQQEICWSLCLTVARGLLETVLRGRVPQGPLVLLGGVGRIPAMAAALEQVLGLRLAPAQNPERAAALGAALLAGPVERGAGPGLPVESPRRSAASPGSWRRPLPPHAGGREPIPQDRRWTVEQTEVTQYGPLRGPLALGIDVGSRSTKAALLDHRGEVAAGLYTWTDGHALEATGRLLRAALDLLRRHQVAVDQIEAVGVTGSGRSLVYNALSADLQLNEVTAHARGALHLDPRVDTIFEIGGQDSKFTRLQGGRVIHVEMNYACAAGTGSFIEEQARRLGVDLDQVERLAAGSAAPPTSERCTVFMERDVSRLVAEGCPTPSILAAVLHSVCENYLNKVVGSSPLGERVAMQGATALNGALVSAFEQRLGRQLSVSCYCHITGALGAALAAREARDGPSRFRGFELAHLPLHTAQQTCELCSNHCQITTLSAKDISTGWGMRCGRELADDAPARAARSILQTHHRLRMSGVPRGVSSSFCVGYPAALYLQDQRPLWQTFWASLGVELYDVSSSPELLEVGRNLAGIQTCAPAALLLGQAWQARDADYLFLPTLVRGDAVGPDCDVRVSEQRTDACFCFVSQYLPTVMRRRAQLDHQRLISPVLSLNQPPERVAAAIHEATAGRLPFDRRQIMRAYQEALHRQRAAGDALRAEGRRVWAEARREDRFTVVLLGMPYILQDPLLNLDLPRLLEEQLGVRAILGDMLPEPGRGFDQLEDSGTHWQYAKHTLASAEQVAGQRSLYAIYLSAFHCGPDALVIPRLRAIMERAQKPYLVLQLDAQGSDTGLVTRVEAGLDAFAEHHRAAATETAQDEHPGPAEVAVSTPPLRKMHRRGTFLVPNIDPMICRLWEAAFCGSGFSVYFYDQTPGEVQAGQRYTSGGECLAIPGIIGGAVKVLEAIGAGGRTLFVPTCSYSCVYPEFTAAVRRALDRAGFGGVPVYAPNLFSVFPGASLRANAMVWECVAASDLLRQAAFEVRPDEREPGATDRALRVWLGRAEAALRRGRRLRPVVGQALAALGQIPRTARGAGGARRPRVLLVGNLFLRYNPWLNGRVVERLEAHGARICSPPVSDYTLTARLQNRRLLQQQGGQPWRRLVNHMFVQSLTGTLASYQRLAQRAGVPSPPDPFEELEGLVSRDLDLPWSLGGETLSVLGRVLQAVRRRRADAVVHVNSLFCQPAYVSEALLEKVLEGSVVPLVNIYCDGSSEGGADAIEPLIHFLKNNAAAR